ncbi:hypothetical protein MRX96_056569 [Rhipicephalus microplus]
METRTPTGSYRCQVHNKLTGEGHLSTSAGKIIVTEPHSQLPPRMAEYRSELEVEQGERAVLPCLAQGHPPPRHHWFRVVDGVVREGIVLHGSSSGSVEGAIPLKASDRVSVLPGGTLLLHAARILDSGKYLCVANNSAGEDRAYTDLLVTVPLSAHIEPPVQVVDVGRSANMSCRVVGHPVHGMLWTHNGHPVSGSPCPMEEDRAESWRPAGPRRG